MTSTTGTHPPIHRRFNEKDAIEQIRNRYTRIREKIPNQLVALQQDSRFREFCADLYSRGFKDWMIIAVIYNVVLNLKLRKQGVNYLDREELERVMRPFASATIEDVFPTKDFIGAGFDRCLMTFHAAVLSTWGFHPRLQLIKPEVVEKFLRERMRHFDYDLPHDPVFGNPPGDWPK